MDLFDALFIALFVIPCALVCYVLYQRKKAYKLLVAEFPNADIISVRFCSRDTVASGQPPSKASGAGYFILSGNDCLIRGKHANTGIEESMAFGSDTKMALIHKVNSAVGFPDIIRLRNDRDTIFLFADKRSRAHADKTRELHGKLKSRFQADSPVKLDAGVFSLSLYPLLIILLVSVAAVIYFSLSMHNDYGVEMLARSPDGYIAASSSRELAILDPSERLIDQISWSELGVEKGANDLVLLSPQTVLVGDFQDGLIKRCSIDTRSCQALEIFNHIDFRFKRTFKFALTADGSRIMATDTARHDLIEFNLTDNAYLISNTPLCFPNRVRIGPVGQLVVADTNNHRLLEWPAGVDWIEGEPLVHAMVAQEAPNEDCQESIANNAFLERPIAVSQPAEGLAELRRGRIWPTDFSWHPNGSIWVLVGGDNLQFGDVAILDKNWQFEDKARGERNLNLIQVLAVGDDVVQVASENEALPVLDSTGEYVRNLSADHLLKQIERYAAENTQLGTYNSWAMVVLVLSILMTLLIALLSQRKIVPQLLP